MVPDYAPQTDERAALRAQPHIELPGLLRGHRIGRLRQLRLGDPAMAHLFNCSQTRLGLQAPTRRFKAVDGSCSEFAFHNPVRDLSRPRNNETKSDKFINVAFDHPSRNLVFQLVKELFDALATEIRRIGHLICGIPLAGCRLLDRP